MRKYIYYIYIYLLYRFLPSEYESVSVAYHNDWKQRAQLAWLLQTPVQLIVIIYALFNVLCMRYLMYYICIIYALFNVLYMHYLMYYIFIIYVLYMHYLMYYICII